MLTYDARTAYVADRQKAREQAATAARTGRLLRRARRALGATGPAGSARPAVAPVPALPARSLGSGRSASSPVAVHDHAA